MSMISEQVKKLRELADGIDEETRRFQHWTAKHLILEAADTIEALSAKLQAANAELERWHTDHINEKIKNPFAYTSTLICHNCDHKDEYIEELEAEAEELKAANMERNCNEILKEIRRKAQELSNQHWGGDERHLIGKGIQCMCIQAENIIKANMERSAKNCGKDSSGKSILIIDTPENCNDCPLFAINHGTLDVFCVGFTGKRKEIGRYIPSGVQRPSWCPLRESAEDCSGWVDGNKVIEEIEKVIDGVIVKDTYSKGKNAGLRKAKIFIEEQMSQEP